MANILHLDACGLICPKPVLKVKAIIDKGHLGPLAITLDNEASAINVATFMQSAGLVVQTYQQGGQWLVLGRTIHGPEILVWHGPDGWQTACDDQQGSLPPPLEDEPIIDLAASINLGPLAAPPINLDHLQSHIVAPDNTTVLVGSQFMGQGDDILGARLTTAFFDTLAAIDSPPALVAFYNSGVFLTTQESATLDAIKDIAEQGAVVISCGVCLDFFKLNKLLKVGRVGNMYEIINAQRTSNCIIQL
ncbi:MAG: sulfurtransferase-like selenium metabolism protein YedF [Candidatus Adiutrix sp.]